MHTVHSALCLLNNLEHRAVSLRQLSYLRRLSLNSAQRATRRRVFRSKKTADCGTRPSIRHSRWVRSLTTTAWVCPDTAETPATPLWHRLILHWESPTGFSSALRIGTTTTTRQNVPRKTAGGIIAARDVSSTKTAAAPGMLSPMHGWRMSPTPAWWSNSTDTFHCFIAGMH